MGLVLAGAGLTLAATAGVPVAGATPVARIVATTTTTASGQFVFEALSAGTYVIIAELGGFARGVHPPISVIDGQSVEIRLALAPAALAEVVTVVGSTGAGDPIEEDQFQALFLRVFQLPTDRFQEVTCPP